MDDKINIITLDAIFKNYISHGETYKVLSDISAFFRQGSFNVILGESGSGKTTLLKILSGLLYPTKGDVFFKGTALNRLNFSQLAEIRLNHYGFMFQEAGLLNHLTCAENILFPKMIDSSERLHKLAEYFGILYCLKKFPENISQGEKQRVALVRALYNKPEVIIADEPTANLDWKNGQKSMKYLKEYSDMNTTVFVATHDERITEFASNTVKIQKGRLFKD